MVFLACRLLPKNTTIASCERFAVLLFSSSSRITCKTLSTKEKKSLAPYACRYVHFYYSEFMEKPVLAIISSCPKSSTLLMFGHM